MSVSALTAQTSGNAAGIASSAVPNFPSGPKTSAPSFPAAATTTTPAFTAPRIAARMAGLVPRTPSERFAARKTGIIFR